ncbi:MAG: hypothetical protein Tsb009_35250 [Planctomycetaceae bacterium]
MANPVELWKAEKHPFDVWSKIEEHAVAETPMADIDSSDLERMKWYGFFYRKRDLPGRYMSRIRVTAGELNSDQAREIATLSYEYGHGIVDITTRANLQVQGLEISHLPNVERRLSKVGLSSKQTGHDNIRNVFAHPFSGLMPDELIDTRQLCHDVTALFIDSREYSDLPRKLNVCLNGTEHHSAHFWTQDLSYLATKNTETGDVAFQVLLAGTQGQNPRLAWHLPVLVRPDQVVDVTRAIFDLFRAKGSREKRNAARLRFLVEEIGIGGVLKWLEEKLPFPLEPCIQEPSPASSHDELIGWFRQADAKRWTMGLSVPLGRMTWQQLEGLAILAKRWGNGELRTTHEQGIAVINIPTGFKDAAATAAAALGLSIHADPFERNTMACTGSQFCNIAVTETKGHMFQLIDKLRRKALKLHGIRIHMSGCPSSCAQHFTADIGLKGVRVRRLLGTREGFDVYLGGGIAGQVHMGVPYQLGVDVDQLPTLIESVINEFYLRHRSGQTFSAYWRERLIAQEARKVGDDDYKLPIWICDACEYEHNGEDPPVFCPGCAGLRRNFARLEEHESAKGEIESAEVTATVAKRDDGFVFAVNEANLSDGSSKTVSLNGHEYALFRENGTVYAIDSECPHEGAPLADGEIKDGVVTCPWHSWTFNACNGCSLDPPGRDIGRYETLVEDGKIFIRPNGVDAEVAGDIFRNSGGLELVSALAKPCSAQLTVMTVTEESQDVRTFRLDNSAGAISLDCPGRFLKVCVTVDGEEHWRSFTICSSPTHPKVIDLTIKRNPIGVVSNYLFENVDAGSEITVKGPLGGYFLDPEKHPEPLVLISAGSGITPMMSIARFLKATGNARTVFFLYGARTEGDLLFRSELESYTTGGQFQYVASLSQPSESWTGKTGRISMDFVRSLVPDLAANRFFLCGPNDFMDSLCTGLMDSGVATDRIHTEQFHSSPSPARVMS